MTSPATRRRVSVLGATGSIGRNTVALLEAQGGAEAYDVVAVTGASDVAGLAGIARRLRARLAVTAEPARYAELKAALAGSGVAAAAGPEALAAAAAEPADWTMSAIVGAAGLAPGLAAARRGGVLALANKESLVCAGDLLKRACAAGGATLIPVDSEHSAIFQCLRGERASELERVVLTASGGPFRDWPIERMARATLAEAMAHPNWSMGQRISIDSATMFNKALEVIETTHLFAVGPDEVEVVVHPQSVVHSMVGFADGAVMAQLGPSDMKGAIGFALNWPARAPLPVRRLDLAAIGRLDFAPADPVRFPALRLAREALALGGLAGAALNAAKEAALDGFIQGRIGFLDMAGVVEHVMDRLGSEAARVGEGYGLDEVTALDAAARREARALIATGARMGAWS
ncbi:1-deoxy-D-xylulose-5-phosphate reductoisomerase [Amaricoccus sp.]|uniref:1-deoxy-D-xylulose-5-phosphate reductoisomerase n=1 Tax=Amaricoccus sp. TaxID=1872485 RepID=UPI001B52D9C4|nr:1-deoxy-D-xylulose-5-phosphate reductoisomerase [Amaricoccus sp.]MBP7001593.1 1-deoxy-D-xylulose-5-phosphate reductoisomerase [Amaricoccus sp.]